MEIRTGGPVTLAPNGMVSCPNALASQAGVDVPRALLRRIYLPSATSWVFSSLHMPVGMAFVGAFVGGYLDSAKGVG